MAATYQRGLHKAARAAAVENDGTRNVWDLFEGLWQCATHARIGKVLCLLLLCMYVSLETQISGRLAGIHVRQTFFLVCLLVYATVSRLPSF